MSIAWYHTIVSGVCGPSLGETAAPAAPSVDICACAVLQWSRVQPLFAVKVLFCFRFPMYFLQTARSIIEPIWVYFRSGVHVHVGGYGSSKRSGVDAAGVLVASG